MIPNGDYQVISVGYLVTSLGNQNDYEFTMVLVPRQDRYNQNYRYGNRN